jgi:hypothetical protein
MNNPLSRDPAHALFPHPPGCTGHTLWRWSGLTKQEYLDRFERRNVLPGREWDLRDAREVAPLIRESLVGRRVVLLGSPVNSLMRGGTEHELAGAFVWRPSDARGGLMAMLPHPSGRNRFYNDPLAVAAAEIFMQELAQCSS